MNDPSRRDDTFSDAGNTQDDPTPLVLQFNDIRSFEISTRHPKQFDAISKGKPLHFCTCGLSKNFPFCDGSHEALNVSNTTIESTPQRIRRCDFQPLEWTVSEDLQSHEALELEYSKAMVLLHCHRHGVPRAHVMAALDSICPSIDNPPPTSVAVEQNMSMTSDPSVGDIAASLPVASVPAVRKLHRTLLNHFKLVIENTTDEALADLLLPISHFTLSDIASEDPLTTPEMMKLMRAMPKHLTKLCLDGGRRVGNPSVGGNVLRQLPLEIKLSHLDLSGCHMMEDGAFVPYITTNAVLLESLFLTVPTRLTEKSLLAVASKPGNQLKRFSLRDPAPFWGQLDQTDGPLYPPQGDTEGLDEADRVRGSITNAAVEAPPDRTRPMRGEGLVEVLRRHGPMLEEICFSGMKMDPTIWDALSESCSGGDDQETNLVVLDVACTPIDDECLTKVLHKCKKIQYLDISRTRISDAAIFAIGQELPTDHLKGLSITGCPGLALPGADQALCRNFADAEVLRLGGLEVKALTIRHLVHREYKAPLSLQILDLRDFRGPPQSISTPDIDAFFDMIASNNTSGIMKHLMLGQNKFGLIEYGGVWLGNLTKDTLGRFLKSPNIGPGLITLDVGGLMQVDDSIVDIVADNCTSLEALILSDTAVTTKGLCTVAEKCPNLRFLECQSVELVDDSVVQALATNPICTSLVLLNIQSLVKEHPYPISAPMLALLVNNCRNLRLLTAVDSTGSDEMIPPVMRARTVERTGNGLLPGPLDPLL